GPEIAAYDSLAGAIAAYVKQANDEVGASEADFRSAKSSATVSSGLLAAVALLIASGLAFLIARAIRRPLAAVQHAAQAAASGDLPVNVAADSTDEIGLTASAFQQMIESFRAALGKVSETAGSLTASSEDMAATSEEAGRAVGEIANAVATSRRARSVRC